MSSWDTKTLDEWKAQGVQYVYNSRTKQQMPLYYQLYEDNVRNHERLDIPAAISRLLIPILLIHGTDDETVPVAKVAELHRYQPTAEVLLVENGQHTFGGHHPYKAEKLPEQTQLIVESTVSFFKQP